MRSHPRGYRAFELPVDVTGPRSEHLVRVDLDPYRRREVLGRGVVFAGLGQRYLDRPFLAWTLATVEATGIVLGISGDISMRSRRDEYRDRLNDYRSAVAEEDILAAREAMNASWRRLEVAEDRRRKGGVIAVSAVAAGLLDGLLRFPRPALEGRREARSALDVGRDPAAGLRVAWRTRFR